jgi:hypothetical protein
MDYYGGKGQTEVIRAAITEENNKSKTQHIPEGNAEISSAAKDLKDAGVMIPNTSPLNFPDDLYRKQKDPGE